MKFAIRDLLFATVIVALAVSWWLDHRRNSQGMADAQAKMQTLEARYEDILDHFMRLQSAVQSRGMRIVTDTRGAKPQTLVIGGSLPDNALKSGQPPPNPPSK